jgi:hypothetical protein
LEIRKGDSNQEQRDMKPRLIVMLTHNDKTVNNALEVFESCKDLPITHWGFKNVGLEKSKMIDLINRMKNSNKKTFLEVVTYSEDECMKGAQIAVELGFDHLMGTIFYDSVYQYLKDKNIHYLPFCGKVSESPSILEGAISDIIADANSLLEKSIFGIDLLAFRHKEGADLARRYCAAIEKPVVIAGSINSFERIDFIDSINPWGFTMGSALFTSNFIPGATFKENLAKVHEYMSSK